MKPIATLALMAAMASPLSAAIIITGNVNAPGAPCTFEITTDISITMTGNTGGPAFALIFDDWVTSDGIRSTVFLPNLNYTINNSTVLTAAAAGVSDNFANTVGTVAPNDGYFFLTHSAPIVSGDVVTLKAGIYNFSGATGFNPATVGTFTGSVFAVNNMSARVSGITAIPEPSAAILGLAGSALLLRRRRR